MKMIQILRKINKFLFCILNFYKRIEYERQYDFMNLLGEPQDDIERSYFQYKGRIYINENVFTHGMKTIVSFFLLIYFFIKISIFSKTIHIDKQQDIFIFDGDKLDILPEIYIGKVKHEKLYGELYLSKKAKELFFTICKRYPFSYYFLFHNLLKLARYDFLIHKYSPFNILCSCEYSNTSSILTHYCGLRKIKHINIMHGELTFLVVISFCSFHIFYVWDDYYINLLKKMKVEAKYIVHTPKCLQVNLLNYSDREKEINDYTFYLQLENKKTLKILQTVSEILLKKGKVVKIRPHPVFTNYSLLTSFFKEEMIEYPKEVSLELSLVRSKNLISRWSTVLYQGNLIGKKIIIDDCSDPNLFQELKKRGYIMLNKEHQLLSNLISSIIN